MQGSGEGTLAPEAPTSYNSKRKPGYSCPCLGFHPNHHTCSMPVLRMFWPPRHLESPEKKHLSQDISLEQTTWASGVSKTLEFPLQKSGKRPPGKKRGDRYKMLEFCLPEAAAGSCQCPLLLTAHPWAAFPSSCLQSSKDSRKFLCSEHWRERTWL